jgi:hypothetical protein
MTGLGLSHSDVYSADKDSVNERYLCSPRFMMQTLGSQWGRETIGPNVWVKALARSIVGPTIVTDVRYENEAEWIRISGTLIHVRGRGGIDSEHSSEHGVVRLQSDLIVDNSGSREALLHTVLNLPIFS